MSSIRRKALKGLLPIEELKQVFYSKKIKCLLSKKKPLKGLLSIKEI